ncbi:hypothetical protein DESC_460039 [Desulfosarcina cetonica]|uniref:hypothetical protein n=1 Tax=Desulfosarcina cetonica TaxID=90730 RepID=UPI0006D27F32|nr:hypothetical protein [Desulfosarcina cetonica]VTR66144.1 hypothetical protein DESC_460039 [Desulfosarcina cetonica]
MQTPEKRWQLLLVADDGRIVPFKRFRGLAIALIVLLVLMILLCAGLGWQWAAERSSHARTREQLAKLRQTADQLKNSHKRLIAALATAQTRPEPVTTAVPPDRKETADTAPADGKTVSDTTDAPLKDQATPEVPAVLAPVKPRLSIVSPRITLDAQRQRLLLRLRIDSDGEASMPVTGRFVAVLSAPAGETPAWISIPPMALPEGRPSGSDGQEFSVSQSVDVEAQAPVPKDASLYSVAKVYLFDGDGDLLLEETFPVALPAPPAPTVPPVPQESKTPAAVQPQPVAPKRPSPVTLGDLSVAFDKVGSRFQAKVPIRTDGSQTSPVAGTCVVVLKNDQVPPDRWLTLPDVPLVDGIPAGKGGHAFKIRKYVRLEISRKGPTSHPGYQHATAYVFSPEGEMLLEKTFPIHVRPVDGAKASP